jgi:hypothetical protein
MMPSIISAFNFPMMSSPVVAKSPLLVPWHDPVSGVESLILNERVAPFQQCFYFTIESFSADGRYLWFYCAFPPGGDAYYGKQLAVVDFVDQTVRLFPETQFADASPFVDLENGEVYWTTMLDLWKRGPQLEQKPILVNVFPNEYARNRRPLRVATHLTRSADKKSFAIDAQVGREWLLGDMPLNGDPFRLWQTFDRCYDHAQFSPVDSDLILLAQDAWHDPVTGEKGDVEDRMWLLRRGEKAQPMFPDSPSNMRGHEWWASDGKHVWYVHYGKGVARVPVNGTQSELVWELEKASHAHCDAAGRYIVADCIPPDHSESRVVFLNRETDRAIDVVSDMPYPEPEISAWQRKYHVHPHPRFCLNDSYIIYTTTVRGMVDLALVSVAQLAEKTGG